MLKKLLVVTEYLDSYSCKAKSLVKVLLSAPSLDLSHGGPSENIPKLADGLSRLGVEVGVVSAQDGSFHSIFDKGEVKLFVPPDGLVRLANYPKFISDVIRDFGADIVHDNGIWLIQNHIVCRAALTAGKKLLIGLCWTYFHIHKKRERVRRLLGSVVYHDCEAGPNEIK